MKNKKICVIGLGYVGLPLAINLSKYFKLVGFDKNKERISDLKSNIDITNEIKVSELLEKLNSHKDQYLNSGAIPKVQI